MQLLGIEFVMGAAADTVANQFNSIFTVEQTQQVSEPKQAQWEKLKERLNILGIAQKEAILRFVKQQIPQLDPSQVNT
jgi:hypothetical protein